MLSIRSGRLWATIAVGAAEALLVLAAPAFGAVTQSAVTTPAGPTFMIADADVDDPAFTIAGTSDGTPGDLVDVVCARNTNLITLASDVAVGAGGTFSATVDPDAVGALPGVCVLRAIPDGGPTTADFAGPRLGLGGISRTRVVGGINDGTVIGVRVETNGLGGYAHFTSADGIDEIVYQGPGQEDETDALEYVGRFSASTRTSVNRSALRVDGFNSYLPRFAAGLFAGADALAGLTAMTATVATSAATGQSTVVLLEPLVRCSGAVDVFPADAGNCLAFTPTGVSLQRTYATAGGGRVVEVDHRFVSTDSAAHAVDALAETDHEDSEAGWLLPGAQEFDRLGDEERLFAADLPGEMFRIFGHEADDDPIGSVEEGLLAITFDTTPFSLSWTSVGEGFDARYLHNVPAGGSAGARTLVGVGLTQRELTLAMASRDDAYSPPHVAITSPPSGSAHSFGLIRVTGTTRDASLLPSVSVNGVAARVESDGFWSADVAAPAGTLALTATATDTAGQAATATRTVEVAAAGSAGPPGPVGPAGPRAPAGSAAPLRLLTERSRVRSGRRVTLRVRVTRGARLTATLRRSGVGASHRVARRTVRAAGTHRLRFRAPSRRGVFLVTITARFSNGATVRDSGTLVVTR